MPFDIPLVIEKEQLSEVPEAMRPLYREKEGKLHLDAVPKADLHKFMETDRARAAEVEAFKKRYEGLDPEVARKALEAQKAQEQKRLAEAGEFDKLLGQTRAEKDAEIAKLKAEADAKYSALHSSYAVKVRDEALTNAAIAAGVGAEFLDDVLLHGKEDFEVIDGKLTPKGHTHDSVEKWLKEKLTKKKGWLGASIGGGTSRGGSGGAPSGRPRSQMSDPEKLEFIKKHGKDKFLSLPNK